MSSEGAMNVASKILELEGSLSDGSKILTDRESLEFQEHAKRWSDIDRYIPAAIVLPRTEADIQKILQWATAAAIPFVPKSGGHSEWSTIGSNGFVLDLGLYSSIRVDKDGRTATIRGSVLAKPLAVALAEQGLFTALGNGNGVGVNGYFLGGGIPLTLSLTGFGSDQILSARMVTAEGDIVTASPESHPDLLWALRGAGHFFGIVTELTVRAYPLTDIDEDGALWMGSFVFPLSRAKEVAEVMKILMDDASKATSGLMILTAPPPHRNPSLVIAARYTGSSADAVAAYKPLFDLKPIVGDGKKVPIPNASDGREAVGVKGQFKRFGICGLRRFNVDRYLQTIEVWKELLKECPDAINTAFNFQWDSRYSKAPEFESAMCLHDIRYWQNNLIWYTDPASRIKIDEYNDRSIAIARGDDKSEYADYQNGTRTGPIELRYRGEARLEKLRRLKAEWDPKGIFTNQLL